MSLASLIYVAARQSLRAFAEAFAWYLDKNDVEQEGLKLHENQSEIVEIQEWCEDNNVACRICSVKPRRAGSSTISVTSMYHALMKRTRRGCIMAGRPFQLYSLFKMLRLLALKDRTTKQRAQVLTEVARFPNGSEVVAVNAASESSAVSAGFTFLIVTELSKWATEGVAAAAPVLSAALKCVPYLPGTTIIIESTAEGVGDEFHRIYSTGITFAELKAGKIGYVKVFTPWFKFRDSVLEASKMGINTVADLTADEIDLVRQYGLSLDQVAWMRYTIHDQCHDSFEEFKRDYPFNDVECFLLSGAKVFSMPAIKKMREMLPSYPPIAGVLDIREPKLAEKADPASVIFRPTSASEAKMVLIEYPTEGMKYVIGLDTMTGASAAVGSDPDNHGCIVWRAGFMQQGQWKPPRAVAMLVGDWELYVTKKKYIFIWDPDVLTEMVWRLMLYYGNCLLAGEINSDRGTLMNIHQRGGNVYFQKQWNKREQKDTNSLGWKTDEASRRHLISELGKGIREFANFDPMTGHSKERAEIFLAPILDEAEVFIRKNDGREEAMEGKHDDLIISSGIALCCMDQATTYHRPAGHLMSEPEWMRGSSAPAEKNQYA